MMSVPRPIDTGRGDGGPPMGRFRPHAGRFRPIGVLRAVHRGHRLTAEPLGSASAAATVVDEHVSTLWCEFSGGQPATSRNVTVRERTVVQLHCVCALAADTVGVR
jgi:hypothetical protein